jgi:hypothetical protein
MTTDAYGRYVGRHEAGYSLGDRRRPANKLSGLMVDPEADSERYDRPIVEQRAPRAGVLGTVTR